MTSYDFDLALARHAMWLTRLKLYTLGVGEQDLTPAKAGDSSACELGAWLQGEGARYRAVPGFSALTEAHDRFHDLAAEVVRLHRQGDETEVRMVLEEILPAASEDVTLALQQLRDLPA